MPAERDGRRPSGISGARTRPRGARRLTARCHFLTARTLLFITGTGTSRRALTVRTVTACGAHSGMVCSSSCSTSTATESSAAGSSAINGVSLTVSKLRINSFQITIIPHTLKLTNLIKLKRGDKVNVEFDMIGKYLNNIYK